MKKLAILLAVFVTAACENPQLGIGATFGSGGMSVSPPVSGNVSGARCGERMRPILALAFLVLAACGVDGEPEPVSGGITVSGEAKIGVRGTL
jgi:predicted small secreted protein